ncbi:MAG: DUF4339 domain-containing protein [Verrucomicrobia subdivision 3 bacterium]|nr:DUF4339 domain-containing protein [Limisphaerales bacterium]
MEIHLNRDGQQMGPYSLEQIQKHLAEGSVLPADLAWHEGLPEWVPVQQLAAAAPAKKESWFTLKRVVIGSAIWFVLMMAISIGIFYHIFQDSKNNRERNARAAKLGAGMGALTAMGWGVLWLPWAAQVGKRRREAKARELLH